MNNTTLAPLIVGIGGTVRTGSATEVALKVALHAAEMRGARTMGFFGSDLTRLGYYPSDQAGALRQSLVSAIREADGFVIASPAYHGSVSGLVKNALDYIEDTASDVRPYLNDRPVGLITCAFGWQAIGSTLAALRSITHALRGWPTPFGVGLNTSERIFADGQCTDAKAKSQLELVGTQVFEFASTRFEHSNKRGAA